MLRSLLEAMTGLRIESIVILFFFAAHYYSFITMKVKVTLYVAGRVFYEIVYARDYEDARITAKARNPKAQIVSVNAIFD